jgi:asparagine synthetase B (glutamine-hydrolysing)
MDSTSVAATAVGLLGKPAAGSRLKAFTIELDGVADKQEGEYAQQVSDWLGLEREVLRAGSYPLRDPLVPEFVAPAPVPYLPTGVQRDLILRTASVGRVALTGQGGDGVLNFRASYWIEWVVTGKLLRLGTLTAEHLRLFGNPPELFPRAAWRGFRARDPVTIPRWISESFVRRTELRERNAPRVPPWRPDPDSTGFIGSAFWSDVLGWHDPEFTRLPLQFRHPFFDLELVEFAAGLPPVPWIHRKTVLRQAMQGLLPEAVLTRRKEVLDRVEGRTSHLGLHRNLPELFTGKAERFFDCAELAKACQETEITSWGMDSEFMSSIGLAYWLFHWRRPEPVRHPRPPVARRPEHGGRE